MHIFIFNLTFYIFDLTEPLIYKRFIYRVFCGLSKVFWVGVDLLGELGLIPVFLKTCR